MKKKLLAAFLSFCMLFSLVPTAFAEGTKTTTVYVYAKVENDTKSWFQENDLGWITLGSVTVVSDTLANTTLSGSGGYNYKSGTNSLQSIVVNALKNSNGEQDYNNLSLYSKNATSTKEIFEELVWDYNSSYGLTQANGANDYVNVGTSTWHLDGYIDISQYALVTIQYYKGTTLAQETKLKKISEGFTPSDYADEYSADNYALKSAAVDGTTVSNLSDKITLEAQTKYTITLQYDPQSTVTVNYNDGTTENTTENVFTGDTYTLTTPTRDGYTFNGWKVGDTDTIVQPGTQTVNNDVTYTAQWTKIAVDRGDVTVNIDGWNYDGTTADTHVTATDANNNKADSYIWKTADGTELTSAPKDAGTYTVTAVWNATSDYLAKTSEPKTFTIGKRTVNLTSGSKTDEYTADGVTNSEVNTDGTFANGEGFASVKAVGKASKVNESVKNTIEYELSSATKAENYNIVKTEGDLLMTAKSISTPDTDDTDEADKTGITVTTPDDVTYNGQKQEQKPVVKDGDTVLTEGVDYNLSYTGDTTNPGKVTVTVTGIGNYTGAYDVTYNILPKDISTPDTGDTADDQKTGITVTTPDDVTYNGQEQKQKPVVKDGDKVLEEGKDYTLNYSEDVTNPGTVTVTITGMGNYTGETTVTYEIKEKNLNSKDVTVDKLNNVKYNGSTQELAPVVKDGNTTLTAGKDYTVSYSKDTTNAGTVTVTITGTGDYTGTVTTTYDITKRDVTLTSGSSTGTYTGNALTNSNVTVSGDGFATGESYTYDVTGTITNVGTADNTFTATPAQGVNANNYNINIIPGKLTIAKKGISAPDSGDTAADQKTGITVDAPADTTYNGQSQQLKPVVKYNGKTLTEGTDYTLTYSKNTTDAGKVTVTVTGINNFDGSTSATYQINQRKVTLTSANDSKVYDGQPLTNSNVTVGGDGFVTGESYTYSFTGAITDVGTAANEFTATAAKGVNADNYDITIVPGELKVTTKAISTPDKDDTAEADKTGITVTAPENTVYNGQSQQQKPVVKDGDKVLEEGKDYVLTYPTDTTDAAIIILKIDGIGNYSGTCMTEYEITKRPVTLTSGSASKTYDGKALTSTDITVGGEGFVAGEDFIFNVTGTITNVGKAENTFTATAPEGVDADNYDITIVPGELVVEQKAISAPDTDKTAAADKTGITIDKPADVTYNGKEQKQPIVVKDGDKTLVEGVDYTLTYSQDLTNPGTVTVTVTGIGNYSGEYTVTYTINAAAVAPKTADSAMPGVAFGALLAAGLGLAVITKRKKYC